MAVFCVTRSTQTMPRLLQCIAGLSQAVNCVAVCLQTQRLRFDFNLPRGMSGDEVRQVEDLVNSWVQQDHGLATHVVPLQEAKDKGD